MIKFIPKLFKREPKPRFIIEVSGGKFYVEEYVKSHTNLFGDYHPAGYTGRYLYNNGCDSEEEARAYIQEKLDRERKRELARANRRVIEVE